MLPFAIAPCDRVHRVWSTPTQNTKFPCKIMQQNPCFAFLLHQLTLSVVCCII